MMFEANREILDPGVHRYTLSRDGEPVSRARALDFLERDGEFRRLLIDLMAESPFQAFRWETPPLTRELANRNFEFVLLDSPFLAVSPDTRSFARYFRDDDDRDIVCFDNLGGDALLIVPSPRAPASVYSHLAAFVRGAPTAQVHALWSTVGRTVKRVLDNPPLWVSTAGGGVAWLHVRLDSRPKYYAYGPYVAGD